MPEKYFTAAAATIYNIYIYLPTYLPVYIIRIAPNPITCALSFSVRILSISHFAFRSEFFPFRCTYIQFKKKPLSPTRSQTYDIVFLTDVCLYQCKCKKKKRIIKKCPLHCDVDAAPAT